MAPTYIMAFSPQKPSTKNGIIMIPLLAWLSCCRVPAGMPSSERQLETLFKDLDALNQGTINIDDFRVLILGSSSPHTMV